MDTDATDFLAHSEWVAELARELVRDAHDAEDLAQSARLAALERPPDARASLRGWFATVLRNLRRSELKTTARRAQREASVARELASEPHDDVFERFETQRMVSAAVAQLDEPYRTAILLRYFEGLAPREIARRTRVPVRTVHTHLARGLGRLRSTLDRRHGGDRSRWFAALAPLAGGAKWNRAWLEILYVKSNVKLAAAAAAIALLIGAGYYGSRPATPRETEIAPLRQPASVERVDPPARARRTARGSLRGRERVARAPIRASGSRSARVHAPLPRSRAHRGRCAARGSASRVPQLHRRALLGCVERHPRLVRDRGPGRQLQVRVPR